MPSTPIGKVALRWLLLLRIPSVALLALVVHPLPLLRRVTLLVTRVVVALLLRLLAAVVAGGGGGVGLSGGRGVGGRLVVFV